MRILASNPDTIGDLILRQPLYAALGDAGHELTLIVRRSAAGVVPLVAPGANVILLPREVYGVGVDAAWDDFAPTVAAARDAKPELLLVAPYQWTRFEERLAESLREAVPGLLVAGLTGRLFDGDPYAGEPPASTLWFDRTIRVDEDLAEAEKNAALADMLGRGVSSVDPVIAPDPSSLDAARAVLAERGLTPGEFYVACVTGTRHVPIKAWPAERWAELLRRWSTEFGRRFLFVGLPDERDVVERVRAAMGDASSRAEIWMEPDGTVAQLAAVASLSRGYVGHDTGPMHVVAAAGKPALAIFGGGHKLRFLPRVTPSVSLSMRVPCAGCGWACSFDRAHCVYGLSVDDVWRAAQDLETGRVEGREARLIDAPVELLSHMAGFAADLARSRLRETATLRKRLDASPNEEIDRLRLDRDAQARRGEILAQRLASAGDQVRQLEQAVQTVHDEAAGLVRQLAERELTVEALRREAAEQVGRAATRKAEQEKEIAALKQRVEAVEVIQPRPAPVRRRWRERIVDLVCGTRTYLPRRSVRPMPRVLVVARVRATDSDAEVRRTIESVLVERYAHLSFVVATDDAERPVVREFASKVNKIVAAQPAPFAAVADAFAETEAEVVCWIDAGQWFEPGALLRAGEFFRDRTFAAAAAFDETADAGGWRMPWGRHRLDPLSLRAHHPTCRLPFVFYRRQPYALLGPLRPELGHAAGWDLLIRVSRRFGVRRGAGASVCNPVCREFEQSVAESELAERKEADFQAAARAFDATLGPLGRARCAIVHAVSTLRWAFASNAWRDRGWWTERFVLSPTPASETAITSRPVGPISSRPPERLLFASPDLTTDDVYRHRAYYGRDDDAAISWPRVSPKDIDALHVQRAARAGQAIQPAADARTSPYAGFTAGPAWVRWLARVPSPYWRLTGAKAGENDEAERFVKLAGGAATPNRVLVAGCHDGELLDRLKRLTSWTLAGTESNSESCAAASARGHEVWECSPQDAFMTIPDGRVFDVILLPAMLEHWDDPAWALRRLMRLLAPGGTLLLRTPNLDSRLLDRFGPTWSFWQLPYHRVLLGRRGLRKLALACDLKVVRLQTVTDAYAASRSVQINALGLAGQVPDGTAFEDAVAGEGSRLAGWARMLWDRRGRGDEIWAALAMR